MDKKKPLRDSSDKLKDLYNTYVKNDERNIEIEDEDELSKEESSESSDNDNAEQNEEKTLSEEDLSENEILEFKIDDLEKQISTLKDQLLRKTAEMENLRRRSQKEKEDLVKYANEKLLLKMLDIPDDINNALESAKSGTDNKESIIEGIEMINHKVIKIFEDAGVKPMENQVGKEFDVDYHDALLQQPSDEIEEGHIINVIQTGYMYGDKVLRHAKVITSSGSEDK